MLMDGAGMNTTNLPAGRATQRVLIVNGNSDVLELLEPVLDAGNYDVVFVEAIAHAYSQIKRVRPDLVILCVRMDDADGLTVLSMLKLDADTREIPVVTFTSAPDDETQPSADEEDDDTLMFPTRSAMSMN